MHWLLAVWVVVGLTLRHCIYLFGSGRRGPAGPRGRRLLAPQALHAAAPPALSPTHLCWVVPLIHTV